MEECAIFNFPELTEAIHPQTEETVRVLRTPKHKCTLRYVTAKPDSEKHKQCDQRRTRKEGFLSPRNIWEGSWSLTG